MKYNRIEYILLFAQNSSSNNNNNNKHSRSTATKPRPFFFSPLGVCVYPIMCYFKSAFRGGGRGARVRRHTGCYYLLLSPCFAPFFPVVLNEQS